MLPGSAWIPVDGFHLRSDACFTNLPAELAAYRGRMVPELEAYTRYENAVKVDDAVFERFVAMLRQQRLPKSGRGNLRITVRWPDGRGMSRLLRLPSLQLEQSPFTVQSEPGVPNMVFPAVVFRDAVVKNMFNHAGISKRCEFLAHDAHELQRMHALVAVLEGIELGRYPWNMGYMRRLASAYLKRWRELFVYARHTGLSTSAASQSTWPRRPSFGANTSPTFAA